jgi:predicted transcriptional regulator
MTATKPATTTTSATDKSKNSRSARNSALTTKPTTPVAIRARTESENRLWHALAAHPNTTTTHLSTTAHIGRSTAGKILATWETAGTVTRTPGTARSSGRRAADLWALTPTAVTQTRMAKKNSPPKGTTPVAADDGAGTGTTPRLAPGALRGLVEDYLHAHPGQEFSPVAISKALDRSAGAVNNALEKLADSGHATKTKQAPKRFALAAST